VATYAYLTKDANGNRHEGEIRADSVDIAAQKLSQNNQIIISLKEVDTTFDFLGPFIDEVSLSVEKIRNRIPLSNIVFFTRQLSTMFSAGLTLERAIKALAQEEKHPKLKKVLTQVGDNIRKGMSLSQALERHPGVFNTLYIALTKAGEVSGNLDKILEDLATYLENLEDTRRKVKSAMTYPVFMVFFLTGMLSAMFLWIIPKFSAVYAQLGADLPTATQMLVGYSQWMSMHAGKIFLTFVSIVIAIWLVSKTRRGGYLIDSIKINFPIFGNLIVQSILNKFAKTLGILLGAGVSVLESMNLLKKVVQNRVYEKSIEEAADYIRDGFNISTALRRTEVFPSILLQLTTTGEETGELDKLLDHAADYYYKQVNSLVDRMTTLIEPLLILAVGAVIAVMVVITYLPVFSLGRALQSGL